MSITHISSLSQLDGILGKDAGKVSVIDFHATWCGPCHAIAPAFEAMSKQYTNVNFLKCDVDAAQEVAKRYQVSAMPTFVFLRGSTKIDQVRGADRGSIERALKQHSVSSSSTGAAFSGKGQTLGSSPGGSSSTDAPLTQMDPQLKIFLGLIGIYLVFWYLS